MLPGMRDEPSMPVLLRHARDHYRQAIRAALEEAGCGDLPDHGASVLGAMLRHRISAGDVAAMLDISKQSASQLIDALVVRGYAGRAADPADRRRIMLTATDQGRHAARAARRAVEQVDAAWAARIGQARLDALRGILCELTRQADHDH